jgi:hypothetical protein
MLEAQEVLAPLRVDGVEQDLLLDVRIVSGPKAASFSAMKRSVASWMRSRIAS